MLDKYPLKAYYRIILIQFIKLISPRPIRIMEYSLFCSDVKAEVERIMGEDYDVKLEKVIKNNNVTYDALIVMKKGEHMAPTVCLNDCYDQYNRGQDIKDIALSVISWYERYKKQIVVNVDDFLNYSSMKRRVFVKVINAKMNSGLLENVPHRYYYDLAMMVYLVIDEDDVQRGTANVTNMQLNMWNIDEETLFNDAISNTREIKPPKFENMGDVMKELLASKVLRAGYKVGMDEQMDISLARAIEDIENMSNLNVYVLSNLCKIDGAVYMLFDDVLEQIAQKLQSDIYIIPSSIHEVLVLAKEENTEYKNLKDMVMSVNVNHVEPQEVLSDSVYFYKRGRGIEWGE